MNLLFHHIQGTEWIFGICRNIFQGIQGFVMNELLVGINLSIDNRITFRLRLGYRMSHSLSMTSCTRSSALSSLSVNLSAYAFRSQRIGRMIWLNSSVLITFTLYRRMKLKNRTSKKRFFSKNAFFFQRKIVFLQVKHKI